MIDKKRLSTTEESFKKNRMGRLLWKDAKGGYGQSMAR